MCVVAYMPEAEQERADLPKAERAALINADAKLGAFGAQLGYPHKCCAQRGQAPRAAAKGRTQPVPGLYRQVGKVFVVGAIWPEAQSDPRGFDRAVRRALQRLAELEQSR